MALTQGSGKELRRVGEEENVIKIYYMKNYFPNKKKKVFIKTDFLVYTSLKGNYRCMSFLYFAHASKNLGIYCQFWKKLIILSLNIAFTVSLPHTSLTFKVLHLLYAFSGIYPVLYFLLLYFPNSFIFTFLLIDFYLCFTLYIFIPGDAFHPCCIYFGMCWTHLF